MNIRRTSLFALSVTILSALAAPTAQAAPEFINGLALDGSLLDRSGGADANTGRVGYFSDLYYDAQRHEWWGLSDRGPGGGVLNYEPRVQQFRVKVDPKSGAIRDFAIRQTIIFKDEAGVPLNGLAPNPSNVLGRAFDPEGFVIDPSNHHFYVSDEYGPSLYEFNDKGTRVRTFTIPANLIPRNAANVPNFASDTGNTKGKRSNRGFEGLTISPDGTSVYAMLQSAMLDEGGSNGVCLRLVQFSTETGTAVAQYAYQLDGSSQGRGISALVALNNHEFLVLERNNRGLGVGAELSPPNKKLFRIDLAGAVDFSPPAAPFPAANCPAGRVTKQAVPFLDLAANTLPELGQKVLEKWEGVAVGPRLKDGSFVLVTGTDNDYSVTQSGTGEQFDVYFRMTDADPYVTSIFCPLGQIEGCFFHDAAGAPTTSATPTADYRLLPAALHAYKVSAADMGSYVRPSRHGDEHDEELNQDQE